MAKAKDSPQQRRMKDRDVGMLYHGMMKHGTNFQAIIEDREFYLLADFTPAILLSRYSNLVTKKDARFYRLRETLVSSQSAMSSPRSGTPLQPHQSPVSGRSSPSGLGGAASSESSRVIEVIDVAPSEGRGGQFNVRLGSKERSWISKDQFRPRDAPALNRYIKGLEVKLGAALVAYDLAACDREAEDNGSIEDRVVLKESGDDGRSGEKGRVGSVDGLEEDLGSSAESDASEAGTVDLEETPVPLRYSDEPEPVHVPVDVPMDAPMDMPSPEECLEDMFMTQQAQTQQTQASDANANAQRSLPSRLAPARIVEPNPFLLPISIETEECHDAHQEENVRPVQTASSKRRASDADDQLARKKKRIIENMEAARSNPVADEKCVIM